HKSADGTRQAVSSPKSESKMEQNVEKHEYETPSLTVHGSIETITQGGGGNTAIDASFPAHTPIGDLTFS
ncbi:lasso peptide, partial [Mesorhizobium sp. M7A.F.Ca.CA.004.06.1.1]